jgi:hypothetical protein
MRKLLFSIVTLLTASTGQVIAQDYEASSRAKLAEMMAFIRLASEPCAGSVPSMWGFEVLALYVAVKPPIPEAEIKTKETEVARYRTRLGLKKWCQLYAVEMKEAHIIVGIGPKNQQ